MSPSPAITFILSTRNRCATTLETLSRIGQCGLGAGEHEIFIVDNASTDGTPAAVAREFPDVRLIQLDANRGSVAKNVALSRAGGEFVVFLDDDSYPLPGSLHRMIAHFQGNPRLGAASFAVRLPSGRRECSAYPDVFIGCGVGLRKAAIEQVGSLPDDFFMQAEEYDLSLRLLDAGWEVRTFEDLHVMHAKSPATRSSAQKMRLDVRNNLLLVARRFPEPWREPYMQEWMSRYWAMARVAGRRMAALQGFAGGAVRQLATQRHEPVSGRTFEQFAKIGQTRQRLREARDRLGLKRVVLIDWGKNLLAHRLACESAGVQIMAIADPKLAGQRYRDIAVVSDERALSIPFDAAIVANLSPVHAAARLATWRQLTSRPVIDLFEEHRAAAAVA